MSNVEQLFTQACDEIKATDNAVALEKIRVNYLGKNGVLTALLKSLKDLPLAERKQIGQTVNQTKQRIQTLLQERLAFFETQALQQQLEQEKIDISLPGRANTPGTWHPISRSAQRIKAFFIQLGFEVVEGPEIETEYYNFTALNVPDNHPARAMHDTFYFADGTLLRTHTSPVQIRSMEQRSLPVRLIAPGRVYRCDSDATHTPMFNQVEGLYIDKQVSMAGLKSVLQAFFNFFFEQSLALRFRPSYFPFTEPSAEVDIECTNCNGAGCQGCKYSGWLEVLGCGMVHPNVLRAMNVNAEEYTGWAFGMGIDRLTMLRYQINDLRLMFDNDLRFLKQFVSSI